MILDMYDTKVITILIDSLMADLAEKLGISLGHVSVSVQPVLASSQPALASSQLVLVSSLDWQVEEIALLLHIE